MDHLYYYSDLVLITDKRNVVIPGQCDIANLVQHGDSAVE